MNTFSREKYPIVHTCLKVGQSVCVSIIYTYNYVLIDLARKGLASVIVIAPVLASVLFPQTRDHHYSVNTRNSEKLVND